MLEQTIPAESGLNGHQQPAPKRPATAESLADDLFGVLSEEAPANDQREPVKERTTDAPPKKRRERAPEPEEEADEREPDRRPERETEPEPEDEPEDETAQEPEEREHARGSRDKPFTVKDLSKEHFIELKIDGEKETVSLAELGDGYIRERTFTARVNKTKKLADEAEGMLREAVATKQRVRESVLELLGDPVQIYEYFMATADREKVFEEAARRYAALRIRHREQPDERLAFERRRDQLRLQQEREAWESERQAAAEEERRKKQAAHVEATFKPGWQEGLRRAGFPTPTKELFDEVVVRVNQLAASGTEPTSEDIAKFVERAAKLLDLKPAGEKPKPAPRPPPREERTARRGNGRDWSKVAAHERRRNPDYFLSALSSKDFR